MNTSARARARARAYDDVPASRLRGVLRIIGFILAAIVVLALGMLLIFKALDWVTGTPGALGGHEHIL